MLSTALLIVLGLLFVVSTAYAVARVRREWRAPVPPARPTFDEHAAAACKVARRELHIDTTTGSHDRLPINDHNRQMLTAYCEGMWRHTQEMP